MDGPGSQGAAAGPAHEHSTGTLNPDNSQTMVAALREHASTGAAIVIATHDPTVACGWVGQCGQDLGRGRLVGREAGGASPPRGLASPSHSAAR